MVEVFFELNAYALSRKRRLDEISVIGLVVGFQ